MEGPWGLPHPSVQNLKFCFREGGRDRDLNLSPGAHFSKILSNNRKALLCAQYSSTETWFLSTRNMRTLRAFFLLAVGSQVAMDANIEMIKFFRKSNLVTASFKPITQWKGIWSWWWFSTRAAGFCCELNHALTCDQALYSFRWVKHSGDQRKRIWERC